MERKVTFSNINLETIDHKQRPF